jgi:phosphomevalonate kinase
VSYPAYHSLTVPGNLLLAGEYAVLEEGGLGLACAVEPRVHVTWQPSDHLVIETQFEDQQKTWSPQITEDHPLLNSLWDSLTQQFGSQVDQLKYTLTVDSTALARNDKRKSGLGSSAAATVAATAALWYLITHTTPDLNDLFQTALIAHRQTQGGQGSGYDLACSTFGGMGLVTGGKIPTWTPLSLDYSPSFELIFAPKPISTAQAISRWTRWKTIYPDDWARYLHQSQQIVSSLAQSQESETFETTLVKAAGLGRQLGQDMGVWDSANQRFIATHEKAGPFKSLGAGNELFARCCKKDDPARCPVATKGLLWY